MKTFNKVLCALLLLVSVAAAQNVLPFFATPQQVSMVSATNSGVQGSTTACYWVVAIYAGGKSAPAGPSCTFTSNATLSASNFNIVTFLAPTTPIVAPTGFDILKTTSQTPPTGACACSVANNQSSSPVNDTANSTGAYTVSTATAQALLFLDNSTTTTATFKTNIGGTTTALPTTRVFVLGPFAAGAASADFVVDAAYKITSVSSVEATQATAGCTVTVERNTGTTAAGSGTAQLSAAFNLQTQAINTVTAGTLIGSPTQFVAGTDRMGLTWTGACTTLAGAYVTIVATITQ